MEDEKTLLVRLSFVAVFENKNKYDVSLLASGSGRSEQAGGQGTETAVGERSGGWMRKLSGGGVGDVWAGFKTPQDGIVVVIRMGAELDKGCILLFDPPGGLVTYSPVL